ncbi:hypothetical protein [Massilia sp. CF038]|uniref:hypothetical protein n=1 Tax=Massilia sp. CF038 TaxID=1881045 RepID=UPI000923994C|nr:hypothetical protein [Massilia sp. CF038]SHH06825.1 hypothetical protein SAMN05428948_2610 [Massilia sp. CF038]
MGRLLPCSWILAAVFIGHDVRAANEPPAQRALSETERKTFYDFYQKAFPDDHSDQPVFTVGRADGGKETVLAVADSPPRRGLRSLCRMQRRSFAYNGTWAVSESARQLVWLDAKGCSKSARPVRLVYPMPDADVVGLLEHEREVLKSARLLFGGNSQCASRRALNFSLDSIDIGTAGSSSEVLAGLVFKSDRSSSATVWVRRSGLDYNAWTVTCT